MRDSKAEYLLEELLFVIVYSSSQEPAVHPGVVCLAAVDVSKTEFKVGKVLFEGELRTLISTEYITAIS